MNISNSNSHSFFYWSSTDFPYKAAERMAVLIEQSAAHNKGEKVSIALSGGTTPKSFYSAFNRNHLSNLTRSHSLCWFQTDERYVPQTDDQSNQKMILETLFSNCMANEIANFFPVRVSINNVDEICRTYEKTIFSQVKKVESGNPVFDIIILGIGDDGHIASIFPETDESMSPGSLVQACFIKKFNQTRITISFNTIASARKVIIAASDKKKANIIQQTLSESNNYFFPARKLALTKGIEWWIDNDLK
ncbi:MAG: 6-phosphogluconolactonase [Candidatus Riflebacteria bacterium]|nr:6-phosphogluconolactonase [Candidatus Riflebacteria bacterium]